MRRNNPQATAALTNLPTTSQAISKTTAFLLNQAKNRPVFTSYYLIGLLLALFAVGSDMSPSQVHEYTEIMSTVDTQLEAEADHAYRRAYSEYYDAKGWFSCDYICESKKASMLHARSQLDSVKSESAARIRRAKSVPGLFSSMSVSEVRDSFWSYFSRGSKFAKRQTMYDALFMGMRAAGR